MRKFSFHLFCNIGSLALFLAIAVAGCQHQDDVIVGKWKLSGQWFGPGPKGDEPIELWIDMRPDGTFQFVSVPGAHAIEMDEGLWARDDKQITFTFAPGSHQQEAFGASMKETTTLSEDRQSFMLGRGTFTKEP